MTLAAMALYCDPDGPPTRLTGIASWRVKETDRIAAMAAELRKLGAGVATGDDFIEVRAPQRWQPASIRTYDDHRMAMALALAALNPLAPCPGHVPVRIEDPGCTAKTFPGFFDALFTLVSAARGDVPVLAVDGPSASGKGTLASQLAARLGYHLLESGALYRAAALVVLDERIDPHDHEAVARAAAGLDLRFEGGQVYLHGGDVTEALRSEAVGAMASRVASVPAVRTALHQLQLAFRRPPGLVADGRDMGTIVFPDATLKVFLTASAEQRAQRRLKQLNEKGVAATLSALRAELEARDERDRSRAAAPLRPAEDAFELDNSTLSIDESVDLVLGWWAERRPFKA
jgi:3-phosphoshikimate 1-carboxyvinyltransferase